MIGIDEGNLDRRYLPLRLRALPAHSIPCGEMRRLAQSGPCDVGILSPLKISIHSKRDWCCIVPWPSAATPIPFKRFHALLRSARWTPSHSRSPTPTRNGAGG